jgi:uncharacterized repeat protein (TIGR03843 family)
MGQATIERLRTAPYVVVGRFTAASNATLLVRLTDRDSGTMEDRSAGLGRSPTVDDLDPHDLAVYKPRQGETPLWDFPDGTLHQREVAAYVVSEALRWDLVPETVLRHDGPYGAGSLQRFVPHDPQDHFFTLVERDDPAMRDALARTVVFDLLIDNADRKSGHVVLEQIEPGVAHIRLVDHGVTFNMEPKLRTVAWHLAGEAIPAALRAEVAELEARATGLLAELRDLLADNEVAAFQSRLRQVARLARFPYPGSRHPYPWPLV